MDLEKVKGEILAKISELLKTDRRDLMEAMEVCRHLGALYSDLCHANTQDRMTDAAVNGELNSGVLE